MSTTDLPPLPPPEAIGPEGCQVIRQYLAVWNDLSAEQKDVIAVHMKTCAQCTQEYRLLQRATQLVGSLATSSPSTRVDQAVMAAITARSNKRVSQEPRLLVRQARPKPRRLGGLIAAVAAAVLIAIMSFTYFIAPSINHAQAFTLPASLSWNNYVVYHSQTLMSEQGKHYEVNTYHDLATGHVHVETVMEGELDVVAVSDNKEVLGKDMMRQVAQWGAQKWSVNEPKFDLATLRHDLQTKYAVYQGKETYQGQEVYRIRYNNGTILLLDMQYMPVNILGGSTQSGATTSLYTTFRLLPSSRVPEEIWSMNVPSGFKMGSLPAKP